MKSGDATTVEGSTLKVTASGEGVTVDTAKVTKADIEASNGVIHAIDTVVMPAWPFSISRIRPRPGGAFLRALAASLPGPFPGCTVRDMSRFLNK
ncbi:MAG TPA: fasciclin domain-containing protein [Burkholderiales bacterium]|nr:fasciclin domain-containing protein [Burkholderiales bacterium]